MTSGPQPPGQWGAAPPPPPSGPATPRPAAVTRGVLAFLVSIVLGLVGSALILLDLDSYDADLPANGSTVSTGSIAAIGAGFGLLLTAAYLGVLWFAWQGRSWARVVLWVLGGLSVLGILTGPGSPVAGVGVLSSAQLVLVVAGIVLLALRPANEWYRAQRRAPSG